MKNLTLAIKIFEFEAENLETQIKHFDKNEFICKAMNSYQLFIKRASLTGRELPEWKYIVNCAINDVKSRIEPSKGDIDFNNYD